MIAQSKFNLSYKNGLYQVLDAARFIFYVFFEIEVNGTFVFSGLIF